MITDFHPLRPPHQDGGRKGEWCTFSTKDGMVYLLNADRYAVGDIGKIAGFTAEIHFESEADCHRQASEYYGRYGQTYPYMKEWSLMWDVDVIPVAESKTMEFI